MFQESWYSDTFLPCNGNRGGDRRLRSDRLTYPVLHSPIYLSLYTGFTIWISGLRVSGSHDGFMTIAILGLTSHVLFVGVLFGDMRSF